MKWYSALGLVFLTALSMYLWMQKKLSSTYQVVSTTTETQKIEYKPILDSLILSQIQASKEAQILRGIILTYQNDNKSLSTEVLKIGAMVSQFKAERRDTNSYNPNISIKLPDSLFKQNTVFVEKERKAYTLDIKDSTIAISANITKDSLSLTKIDIPNTLILNDEVFDINAEKQIRTTTITNSNPLLNTKPITVINQNWSEKGIKSKKRKAWWQGTAVGVGIAILTGILIQ